jgi:hypothetical protein
MRGGTARALRIRAALLAPSVLALCLLSASCAFLRGVRDGDRGRRGEPLVFYPDLPQEPRIQYLSTYTSHSDVTGGPSFFQRFILGERDDPELGKPYGIAIYGDEIFVCDSKRGAVAIFDLRSRAVALFGDQPPGRLVKPVNIAIDPDGRRYVTDVGLKRLVVYDDENRYETAFGEPDRWSPGDVAIHEDRVYVTDVQNGHVVVFDKESGEQLEQIGRKGSGEGELFFPTNVEVDGAGNVYVADTGNFRVVKFDPRGRFLRQFGSLGRSPGQFARPKGIAVDREDRLYVVDAAFENVQIFDSEGELLLFFASVGNAPGGLNLPAQVEIDYDHVDLFADRVAPGYALEYLIFVSSQFGRNKINVYGFLRPTEERTRAGVSRPRAGPD